MNFYNHHIRSIFKSHSISVTFKFCALLGAQGIHAMGFKWAQGNTHCTKFESNTNRITFEYVPNTMIAKVHPHSLVLADLRNKSKPHYVNPHYETYERTPCK